MLATEDMVMLDVHTDMSAVLFVAVTPRGGWHAVRTVPMASFQVHLELS